MSIAELEEVIQRCMAYHTYQSNSDPIMSAPLTSPPASPSRTPNEHSPLLASQPADHKRHGHLNRASDYGTLDSKTDITVNEADKDLRRNDEEEQPQGMDPAMTKDLAMKEGRRSVMKSSPILATGVRNPIPPPHHDLIGKPLQETVVVKYN